MATTLWYGGTTAAAQVDHLTPGGTIEVGDKFIVTLTGEDGTTTTVSTDATAGSVSQVCADVQANLAAQGTSSPFYAITWTEDGTKVIGTAKVAGVPFYCSVTTTESDDGAADAQTFVRTSSTANAGPNDWNTAANWSGASVPVDDDVVMITPDAAGTSYDIKYGFVQSGIGLKQLRIANAYKGTIGDNVNGHYLNINTNSTADSNEPLTVIEGGGAYIWLAGDHDEITITGASRNDDAIHLNVDCDDLNIIGSGVQGKITAAVNSTLDNVYVLDAPLARVEIPSLTGAVTSLTVSSGSVTVDEAVTTLNVDGGSVRHSDGAVGTMNVRKGATAYYDGSGTLTNLNVYGGTFSLDDNRSSALTITNLNARSGMITNKSGLNNVTVTNDVTQWGATVVGSWGTLQSKA